MRLLYLNHNVAWSGTFQRAFHLAREMTRRGHEVTLVTTSRSARIRPEWKRRDGVRVLEAPDLLWGPGRTGWDPYNVLRRIGALAGRPFDLVHAFDSRPAVIFPALAAARTGATLVMDWADWWGRGGTIEERSGPLVRTLFGPVETWFEESFRTRAAGATVISGALRDRCIGLGMQEARVLQIPNGCEAPAATQPTREEARARLALDHRPTLLHLGTAHRGDTMLLFDALRAARAKDPRTRLLLVGGFRGGIPADLVEGDAVRATGFVAPETLPLWLAAADACTVALRDTVANRGRWPGKVNDYLTAGRSTVMTDVGDAARWIRDASAGVVAAPRADAFGAALVSAVRDDGRRAAVERNARALASGGLAWSGIAARLDDFYDALAGRPAERTRASA